MDQPNISWYANDPHAARWIYSQAPLYEYTCIPCVWSAIGQLSNSSHQLKIQIGIYACKSLEERICWLCHWGVELEDHYACGCLVFMWNKREMPPPFQTRLWPAMHFNGTQRTTMLGTILARIQDTWSDVVECENTTTTHPQRTTMTFFSSIEEP